jgi:hypothetical protein
VLVLLTACGGQGSPAQAPTPNWDPLAIRYRLKLRHNPVDPGEAFRCYGACQSVGEPKAYVECLTECPGFEKTPGMKCDASEIPPETACLTVRKVPSGTEPDPGLVVLAIVGEVLLVVGAASICAASTSACQSTANVPPL